MYLSFADIRHSRRRTTIRLAVTPDHLRPIDGQHIQAAILADRRHIVLERRQSIARRPYVIRKPMQSLEAKPFRQTVLQLVPIDVHNAHIALRGRDHHMVGVHKLQPRYVAGKRQAGRAFGNGVGLVIVRNVAAAAELPHFDAVLGELPAAGNERFGRRVLLGDPSQTGHLLGDEVTVDLELGHRVCVLGFWGFIDLFIIV